MVSAGMQRSPQVMDEEVTHQAERGESSARVEAAAVVGCEAGLGFGLEPTVVEADAGPQLHHLYRVEEAMAEAFDEIEQGLAAGGREVIVKSA